MASSVSSRRAGDLHAAGRLGVDAVLGVTDIVEAMHRSIAARAGIVGPAPQGPTRGITGFVYRNVRRVTRVVGWGLDHTLPHLAPVLGQGEGWPQREAVVAAVNGVLGDHLATSGNALAIPMSLRQGGVALPLQREAIAQAIEHPQRKLLVLAHGLCMNDLQWQRKGHDHGAALAAEFGFTPLYLHYNSGRHIALNGREFAQLLDTLVREWPVPVDELVLIGHSMGGLVSRSACRHAQREHLPWLKTLDAMFFLGTPHQGAPLERAGSWVDTLLDLSPYTAPLSQIGRIRSAGIQDLRHGRVDDASDAPVPLPRGVHCHVIAASKQPHAPREGSTRQQGDGLVPVRSALGLHDDAARELKLPASHRWVGHGMDHFDLLSAPEVHAQLRRWFAEPARPSGRATSRSSSR